MPDTPEQRDTAMARPRQPIDLKAINEHWAIHVYSTDGKRRRVNFGPIDTVSREDALTAMANWLKAYYIDPDRAIRDKPRWRTIIEDHEHVATVGDLIDAFRSYLNDEYQTSDASSHPHLAKVNLLDRVLADHRDLPLHAFTAATLEQVRETFINYRARRPGGEMTPLAKPTAQMTYQMIKRMFQWGQRMGVSAEQAGAIKSARGFRSTAPFTDRQRRRPVTPDEVQAILPHLTPTTAAMVQVIYQTGMRPAEVRRMRPCDIDRAHPECWLYVPGRHDHQITHKTAWAGKHKYVPLTGVAIAAIGPMVRDWSSTDFIFKPANAIAERRAAQTMKRKTPGNHGNIVGSKCKDHPMIKPGEQYQGSSLIQAIRRACERAGVDRFTPTDMRRSLATMVDAGLGKEHARRLLGHATVDTTDIYLLDEVSKVIESARMLEAHINNQKV